MATELTVLAISVVCIPLAALSVIAALCVGFAKRRISWRLTIGLSLPTLLLPILIPMIGIVASNYVNSHGGRSLWNGDGALGFFLFFGGGAVYAAIAIGILNVIFIVTILLWHFYGRMRKSR